MVIDKRMLLPYKRRPTYKIEEMEEFENKHSAITNDQYRQESSTDAYINIVSLSSLTKLTIIP